MSINRGPFLPPTQIKKQMFKVNFFPNLVSVLLTLFTLSTITWTSFDLLVGALVFTAGHAGFKLLSLSHCLSEAKSLVDRSEQDRVKLLAEIAQLKLDLEESQASLSALFVPPPPPPPMPSYEQLFCLSSSVCRSSSAEEISAAKKMSACLPRSGLQPSVVNELAGFFKGGRSLKKTSQSCTALPTSTESDNEFFKSELLKKFKSLNDLEDQEQW